MKALKKKKLPIANRKSLKSATVTKREKKMEKTSDHSSVEEVKKENILKHADPDTVSFLQSRFKKEGKTEEGVLNFGKMMACLNNIEKEKDPEAYEPDICIQYRKREQQRLMTAKYPNRK